MKKGLIIAGGLGTRKDAYFRIGHMGVTAIDGGRGDVNRIISVLREVIAEKTGKV